MNSPKPYQSETTIELFRFLEVMAEYNSKIVELEKANDELSEENRVLRERQNKIIKLQKKVGVLFPQRFFRE